MTSEASHIDYPAVIHEVNMWDHAHIRVAAWNRAAKAQADAGESMLCMTCEAEIASVDDVAAVFSVSGEEGDCVGIVCPACWESKSGQRLAIEILRRLGCTGLRPVSPAPYAGTG